MRTQDSICPICGAANSFTVHTSQGTLTLKNDTFEVPISVEVCGNCLEEFVYETPDSGLFAARKLYREKYGMVKPEEIIAWREELGFSQEELAETFGWSVLTLQRYENGKLAEPAHDKLLRQAILWTGVSAEAGHGSGLVTK